MTIKEQYKRARRNLQKRISRLRSKGFEIAKNALPKIPKRPTKASISRLNKITRDVLIKDAVYVDRSTGEVLTGRQGEKIEREKTIQKRRQTLARKKATTPTLSDSYGTTTTVGETSTSVTPNYDDVVISNFRNEIKHNAKPDIANKVMSWLDSMISNYGVARVADMLTNSAEDGIQVSYNALYSDADTAVFLEKLATHLGSEDEIETAMLEDEIERYFPIDDEFYGNY